MRTATCHPERKYWAKGYCSSCYQRLVFYPKNRQKALNYRQQWKQTNPEKRMLIDAKVRAKRRGMEFTLLPSDISIPETCPVLGIPLRRSGKFCPNSPSLDRIDNTKGYVKDNVIVVSYRANSIKKDATPTELRKIADFYMNLTVQ